MERLANFIVKNRWWIVGLWVVAGIAIVTLSPSLASVESNDESSFLPKGYESIEAINTAKKISPHSQDATDLIVFKNKSGKALSANDQQKIGDVVSALQMDRLSHVANVSTSLVLQISPNRKVQLATVTYSGDPNATATINAVAGVRSALGKALKGTDLAATTTGQESVSYDTQGTFDHALKIVSIGTILLVFVLPALVFGSPVAGILPVLAVGLVDVIASSLIADAAKLFDFKVSQQLGVIFTVVLFGIGTDYMLFLLFRYRERLQSGDHSKGAVEFALSRAGLAILSAALVVLSSFSALFFAKFGIFSSMAPGLVICVGVMMLAALTLVPALVAIIEKKVFWPSKAWQRGGTKATISKRIGGVVARRPATVVAVVVIALAALAFHALYYKSDFSSFSKPPADTQSAAGYNDLVAAFPAGETDPVQVFVTGNATLTQASLKPLEQKLSGTQGIAMVEPATITPNGKTAMMSAILKNDPYSNQSIASVKGPIRNAAHSVNIGGDHVYVGGTTSVFADIQAVSNRDLSVLLPVAGVFIFIILALLLRSLIAPIFLLVAVGFGYAATLGSSVLIFLQSGGFGHEAGLIFFIPTFMYIFVVAIGTDYNILTITRLREEVKRGLDPRKAADMTVEHSSATVASAGLILAATFGSLLLARISFLTQMGTAIAIGVALSAFVIAPFLIPSVSALLGYAIWWPGHKPAGKK